MIFSQDLWSHLFPSLYFSLYNNIHKVMEIFSCCLVSSCFTKFVSDFCYFFTFPLFCYLVLTRVTKAGEDLCKSCNQECFIQNQEFADNRKRWWCWNNDTMVKEILFLFFLQKLLFHFFVKRRGIVTVIQQDSLAKKFYPKIQFT